MKRSPNQLSRLVASKAEQKKAPHFVPYQLSKGDSGEFEGGHFQWEGLPTLFGPEQHVTSMLPDWLSRYVWVMEYQNTLQRRLVFLVLETSLLF